MQGIPMALIQVTSDLKMIWIEDPRELVLDKLNISMEHLQIVCSIGVNDAIGTKAGTLFLYNFEMFISKIIIYHF